MLKKLEIKNVAIAQNVEIDFSDGLNIITGETGAGKSILLSSLSLIFGERADKSLITHGETKLFVKAYFDDLTDDFIEYLIKELGEEIYDKSDFGNNISITRILDLSGKNICKIDDKPCSVNQLKKIASYLACVTGQQESHSIISSDYQLNILDNFIGESALEIKRELSSKIKKINDNIKLYESLGGDDENRQQLLDVYNFNLDQILDVNPLEYEFEDLTKAKEEMSSYEKMVSSLSTSESLLSGSGYGNNILEMLYSLQSEIGKVSIINNTLHELFERIKVANIELKDISSDISDLITNANFSQSEYDRIDSRIEKLKALYRKNGGDYYSTIASRNSYQEKIDNIINSEENAREILKENEKIENEIYQLQNILTELRLKNSSILASLIQERLSMLDMPNARVCIELIPILGDFGKDGAESVCFKFSANKGFDSLPLSKIASGGEMSRFMLAYKKVVSDIDDVYINIFDEIDSGISGNAGVAVAKAMYELSRKKQVIAITHLPSIASYADNHIEVSKNSKTGKTISVATTIIGAEKEKEISRMIGSKDLSSGLMLARQMLNSAKLYKQEKREN